MLNIFAFSSLLIFLIDPITCGRTTIPLSGCDIKILSMYPCEDNAGYGHLLFDLKTINGNGDKAVDVSFTLDEPFNDDWVMSMRIDMYDNDQWKENVHSYDGDYCTFFSTYASKGWKRVTESTEPPIEAECGFEAGTYVLNNFQATPDDMDVAASLYGIVKLWLISKDPSGEVFSCRVTEVELSPKSNY